MANDKILIVEDDEDIMEMIAYNLEKEGYKTTRVYNGEDAVNSVKNEQPAMIILDLMIPKIEGLEVCKIVRNNSNTSLIPIIMLTARSQETDKITGLELGADDYVTKPFSPKELIARIKAVLRRSKSRNTDTTINAGDIVIDIVKYKVTVNGALINLTATDFKLLEYLARRCGEVLSREAILNDVFGYTSAIYDRTVDTHIKTLRKKLGNARGAIETIRGIGYRFKEF